MIDKIDKEVRIYTRRSKGCVCVFWRLQSSGAMLSRQKATNDLRTSLLAIPSIEGATLEACQRSNKEIWKAGLSYDSRELDVVFGELRPEHFFLSGVSPKLMDAYCRSIVIPKSRTPLQIQGANGDGNRSMFFNKDGLQVPKSTLDGGTTRLPAMENQRFKAYLRKYFPHDNIVVQPMDQIMKNLMLAAELGTIQKAEPKETHNGTPIPPSPTRPRLREKMLKFVSVQDLSEWEDEHLESPGGIQYACGITESAFPREGGEQANQKMESLKPPSPTHLSIKEKYMQSASLSFQSNEEPEEPNKAEAGVMARIPIGGRKLLLKKDYAKKRKKEIKIMAQALREQEVKADNEVAEVNPNIYLPPPTPQRRVITVRQKGRTNFVNKNCEYYKQVMESFSIRRKQKREQRRETLIRLANLYSSLSDDMCSVVSENPTPNYALASLRQHQQDPRYRSSSAAVADRSVLQATPLDRLPRASSEMAEEAASKILSQADVDDYFFLLQGQKPSLSRASIEPTSLSCSHQSICSQPFGASLKKRGRVSSLPPPSPQLSRVMKAGDGENNEIVVVGGGGGGGTTGGTFQCPPGMESFWQALSADLAYAQACLVCALLPDLVEANKLGYLMPASPFAPVQRLRSIQAIALNQDFVKHFQQRSSASKPARYSPTTGAPPLSFFILPRWEQRYLGLRPDRDSKKLVIACRRPPEDVRLWLPNGMFNGQCSDLQNTAEGKP